MISKDLLITLTIALIFIGIVFTIVYFVDIKRIEDNKKKNRLKY
jgi:hypothetical protein